MDIEKINKNENRDAVLDYFGENIHKFQIKRVGVCAVSNHQKEIPNKIHKKCNFIWYY